MNFFAIGSINTFMINLKMKTNWSIKKDNLQFKADDPDKSADYGIWESFMESESSRDRVLEAILAKVDSGVKLTAEELQYLKAKNPMAYSRLVALEAEKEGYEKALRRCKTREEVQRCKMSKLAASLSVISSVENNPSIPEGKKLEIIMAEHRRINAFNKITTEFVKSSQYAQLPTEAERFEAEKAMKDAERAETEELLSQKENQPAEDTPPESAESQPAGQQPQPPEDAQTELGESRTASPAGPEPDKAEHDGKKDEPTRAQASQTPEARKVKRANLRAYASPDTDSEAPAAPGAAINRKA